MFCATFIFQTRSSKKMGIEEQDYDDDVCHANELHNL